MNFLRILACACLSLAHANGTETVVYKTVGDRKLKLFIDKPEGWKKEDKNPAIVFFFGGGWVGGTPEQFRRQST